MSMKPQDKKEHLAKLVACRSYLYLHGMLSEKEQEKIFGRISEYQDKERIEISMEELRNAEIVYNPSNP